jgi:beta-phosphoglucomutase-like phosphatase (HAD superfamily)
MMACRITHLVFWAGGVVVTPIWQAAWDAIGFDRQPDASARLELHGLEHGLASGTLSPEEFCEQAATLSESNISASELIEQLPARIDAIPGMPELLDDLSCRHIRLSLVAGIPRLWLSPALQRTGLAQWFAQDEVWTAADDGGFPAVLEALLRRGQIVPGRSLWVDDSSLRTSEALRRGVDAAVFVRPRQLYRDLGLWGLVPFQGARPPTSRL